ncbi:flavin reductase family protein [Croceicoccus estronivorus]|uniref:flavin reductase family protein n=1 Tax=Croceicoccus estronivorus TaxID=1172626 RepID=UPI0038B38194
MDGRSKGASRFSSAEWGNLTTGRPVLQASVCSFDCQVQNSIQAGTYPIILGSVISQNGNPGKRPLIYYCRKFCTIDFQLNK